MLYGRLTSDRQYLRRKKIRRRNPRTELLNARDGRWLEKTNALWECLFVDDTENYNKKYLIGNTDAFSDVPNGSYRGTWDGHIIWFTHNGIGRYVIWDVGMRCPAVPSVIVMRDGRPVDVIPSI